MNAAIRFKFSAWAGFLTDPVNGPQRPDSLFAAARASRGGHRQSRQMTH